MAPKVLHSEKKDLIRGELLKCATATPMQFPTFRAFAERVGMPVQGTVEAHSRCSWGRRKESRPARYYLSVIESAYSLSDANRPCAE